jgi:hypothetical protein
MRRRDWAGTVLVACLAALAALTRHSFAVWIFGAVAVGSLGLIVWDVRKVPRQRPASFTERHEHRTERDGVETVEWEERKRGTDIAIHPPVATAAAAAPQVTVAGQGVPGWNSRVEHALPTNQYPIHGLIGKLYGPEGQPAQGRVRAILRKGPDIIREDEARFDDYQLQPGERPHYLIVLFNPLRPNERLDDGPYELRWIEDHGLGHRDLAEPHTFEIHQGMLVTHG